MINNLDYSTLESHVVTEEEWEGHGGETVLAGNIKEGTVFISPETKEPLIVYDPKSNRTSDIHTFTIAGDNAYALYTESQSRWTGTGYKDYIFHELNTENAIIRSANHYSPEGFYDDIYRKENYFDERRQFGKEVGKLANKYGIPFEVGLVLGTGEASERIYKALSKVKELATDIDTPFNLDMYSLNNELDQGIGRRKAAIKDFLGNYMNAKVFDERIDELVDKETDLGLYNLYESIDKLGQKNSSRIAYYISEMLDVRIEKYENHVKYIAQDLFKELSDTYTNNPSLVTALSPEKIKECLTKQSSYINENDKIDSMRRFVDELNVMNDGLKTDPGSMIKLYMSHSNQGIENTLQRFVPESMATHDAGYVENASSPFWEIIQDYVRLEHQHILNGKTPEQTIAEYQMRQKTPHEIREDNYDILNLPKISLPYQQHHIDPNDISSPTMESFGTYSGGKTYALAAIKTHPEMARELKEVCEKELKYIAEMEWPDEQKFIEGVKEGYEVSMSVWKDRVAETTNELQDIVAECERTITHTQEQNKSTRKARSFSSHYNKAAQGVEEDKRNQPVQTLSQNGQKKSIGQGIGE